MKDGLHKELAALTDELTSDAIATFKGDHARDELTRLVRSLGG